MSIDFEYSCVNCKSHDSRRFTAVDKLVLVYACNLCSGKICCIYCKKERVAEKCCR